MVPFAVSNTWIAIIDFGGYIHGPQLGLGGIKRYAFLDSRHRQLLAVAEAFFHHKDASGSNRGTGAQIPAEFLLRIVADVDNSVIAALAAFNPDPVVAKINGIDGQLGHFLHPQPTAQHQHEHRTVPGTPDEGKQFIQLLVFQIPRQAASTASSP
jgi:hypothetical protein